MVPGDTDDILKEYNILLQELEKFNPEMLDKHRVLAITKCDLLDDELCDMLRESTPKDVQVVFISAVTGQGIEKLKDVLWEELNAESNKLQTIMAEDSLVHRDKDMTRFANEMKAEDDYDLEADLQEEDDDDIEELEDYEIFDV